MQNIGTFEIHGGITVRVPFKDNKIEPIVVEIDVHALVVGNDW